MLCAYLIAYICKYGVILMPAQTTLNLSTYLYLCM